MKLKPRFQEIVDFVEARAPVWQVRMKLTHVDIEHVFLDSYFDAAGDDFAVSATTEGRWNYYQAKIKWYLPSVSRHANADLEKICVHELCHVLLMPEQDLLDYKLSQANVKEEMNEESFHTLSAMYYERMEMATEAATKTIMEAWGPVPDSELVVPS